MPFIAVHMARGRPADKRRRLALAITEAVTEILEVDRSSIQVLIYEHERDNWAVGGELLSERQGSSKSQLPDLDALFKKPVTKTTQKSPAKPSSRKAPAISRSRR